MSSSSSRRLLAVAVLASSVAAAKAPAVHHHAPAQKLGPPELLFTFDDGPNLERTPKILDTLDRYHIKAVFFVNGWHLLGNKPEAERSRALLREILRRGHAVGNHTVHHYFLCGQRGKRVAADEILENARLIEQATGMRPELFRTPYGSHCKQLSATLASVGVTHTGWDIDPQDWKVKDTAKVRDYVIRALRNLHGRNILLMHDVHEDTVRALPQVLEWLARENEARAKRGETPVRVIDYAYLLPPHPAVPPLLDGVGRVLIDQSAPPSTLRAVGGALRLFGLALPRPGTS